MRCSAAVAEEVEEVEQQQQQQEQVEGEWPASRTLPPGPPTRSPNGTLCSPFAIGYPGLAQIIQLTWHWALPG